MTSQRQYHIVKTGIKERQKVYTLKDGKLGKCLIINNVDFKCEDLPDRDGSDKDENRFKNIFENLGFTVIPKRNKTGQEMKEIIESVATDEENEDCSAFVLIVLTHGDEGYLCGTDYNPNRKEMDTFVTYKNIINLLSNKNCKVLKSKPKLCFFQACNGHKTSELVEDCAVPIRIERGERLPEASDILMSIAAQEGFTTMRDTSIGGIYAYNLAQVLIKHSWTCDILEMLGILETEIRNAMTEHSDEYVSNSLCLSTSVQLIGWSKKFYFNPNPSVNCIEETASPNHDQKMHSSASASIISLTEGSALWILGGSQPPECLSQDGKSWSIVEGTGLDTDHQAIAHWNGSVYVCDEFSVYKWTPEERREAHMKKFTQPRRLFGHAMIGDKIFILGGEVQGKPTNTFLEFDTGTENWPEKEAQMLRTCSGRTAVVFQGQIYMAPGRKDQLLNKVEFFNPVQGTWSKTKRQLSSSKYGHTISACDKYLWVFGGRKGGTDGSTSVSGDVERFDFVSEKWECTKSSMPMPRTNMAVAYFEKKFYTIGGLDEKGNALDVVEIYDPQTDEWKPGPKLNCARSGHGAIALPYRGT